MTPFHPNDGVVGVGGVESLRHQREVTQNCVEQVQLQLSWLNCARV